MFKLDYHADLHSQLGLLLKMQKSEYEFHLTGSAYFNPYEIPNDLDFFTEDSPGVRRFLKALWFEEQFNTYLDRATISVFRSNSKIDVQIVECVETKLLAQSMLRDFGVDVSKRNEFGRASMWNAAYDYAKRLQASKSHA